MTSSSRWRNIVQFFDSAKIANYRYNQLQSNIYRKKIKSFSAMCNLPEKLRNQLAERFNDSFLSIENVDEVEDEKEKKVRFKARDGARFDSVLIKQGEQNTIRLSSQAGCAFQCGFCGTGKIGLKRQLTVDEITDQVLYFEQNSYKLKKLSFSAMGEPLANPHVFEALKMLHHADFHGYAARKIYISTIGILPGIRKLNDLFPQENLAFTLNSPFIEERNSLIPANTMYPFPEVLQLLDQRLLKAKRRIWINYLIIKGVNDSKAHAKALIELIRKRNFSVRHLYHVNIMRYNAVNSLRERYEAADEVTTDFFKETLWKNSISCSVSTSSEKNLSAGMGQLDAGYDPLPERQFFGMKHQFRMRPVATARSI